MTVNDASEDELSRRTREPEGWRVRLHVGLIKQVRGRSILEALHRLQNGLCAYDEQPCALILPQVLQLARNHGLTHEHRRRFATIDHVQPRSLGGLNEYSNLVMASSRANGLKSNREPIGPWCPHVRHTTRDVEHALMIVEHERWAEATQLARKRWFDRDRALNRLVLRELERLENGVDLEFYASASRVVA